MHEFIRKIKIGGGGMERNQISDIRPPKKSNIRYETQKKIQIADITLSQKVRYLA